MAQCHQVVCHYLCLYLMSLGHKVLIKTVSHWQNFCLTCQANPKIFYTEHIYCLMSMNKLTAKLFVCAYLTHWGWVMHICISRLTITGSDNGLSPGRRQAIIWTNPGILLIGPLENKLLWKFNLSSNIFIHENAIESVVCEMAAISSRPQCVNC